MSQSRYMIVSIFVFAGASLLTSCHAVSRPASINAAIRNAVKVEAKEIKRHLAVQKDLEARKTQMTPYELKTVHFAIQRSRVTGIMATDAAGYSLAYAFKEKKFTRGRCRTFLIERVREHGLQNWIVAAATVSEVDPEELTQVASTSGIPISPLVKLRD